MKVDLFDFHLPPERIAQAPVMPRDAARLLVVGEEFRDLQMRDLPGLLRPSDLLVFNDTKVIPARLLGKRGEASVELLLHKPLADGSWRAFARPAKRLKLGDSVTVAEDFAAQVLEKHETGEVSVRFNTDSAEALYAALARYGRMPLPPYIRREEAKAEDLRDYQTVFANTPGAVAAPTAGLHFTPELLAALAGRGIEQAFVTLHVGAGTFLPVKVEDTAEHRMHSEWACVSAETAAAITRAKREGRRIVAVGTTSLRTLESAMGEHGEMPVFSGETDIFITPGYRFRCVDALLTNFHLPRSTLFMLVSAFAGLERMQAAYRHAIHEEYRFYSYGDACLLTRNG